MKISKTLLLLVTATLALSSCSSAQKKTDSTVSLKNAYVKNFYIGTALDTNQILETNPLTTSLIAKEFNSITPENCMKSMFLQPEKDKFDFKMADKYVAFGEKHKMFIHGHTLIWHSQLPSWLSKVKDSVAMSEAMTKHISTIVEKYKGRIGSWDVVNEALNEDGTLRKSVFLNSYGKDFLTHAFKLAAKADPKTDLYYNDYNLCNAKKRKGAVELVKNLQKNGAKIDGVGEQGHWNLITPTLDEIEQTILDFSALGVKVAITELDITVLPNPWDVVGADVSQRAEASEKMNPYPKALPEDIKIQLAARYEAIFKLFIKHQDKISRVTLWGVNDGQSWLNDWPIKGRSNYPLLFDRDFKPKEAYNSVMKLKEEKK
ncbi:endo-1,4-beta-xylanase [Flavobacterium franklandianum]|uniref:endo-1,4-beta-xylanase n=1 Tax=Flavobacterium franklandianum TaxID=2594430 RepID=UPI0011798D9F|nr:endo-1,4-beta-xylanase [Flavobacterium franklandianum]TRX22578.1 endo-1,4-beta-xylanase [Flavobacterium franklandianum]